MREELIKESAGVMPGHRLLEELFNDIIAEDLDDQSEGVAGSDNMSAILIDF